MKNDRIDLADGTARLHSLDAVRAAALLLGVLLHATMSFLPGPRIWMVADVEHSLVLVLALLLLYVVHIMRMVTFFLLAGFMARLAIRRRCGPGAGGRRTPLGVCRLLQHGGLDLGLCADRHGAALLVGV